MPKYTADVIFPVASPPIERGVVEIDDEGFVLSLMAPGDEGYSLIDATYVEGWIVPGWINAHCHLELAGLKGLIEENTGINGFIDSLNAVRPKQGDPRAMREADAQMWAEGVMAVVDISNTTDSFGVKRQSAIEYYTLVERFGFRPEVAEQSYRQGVQVLEALRADGLKGNITLHAPYSSSVPLMANVKAHIEAEGGLWSLHFLESESERELFEHQRGALFDRLENWGFKPAEQLRGFRTVMDYMQQAIPRSGPLLFVHNTHISDAELDRLGPELERLFFCLCPEANRFIEAQLPPLDLLSRSPLKLCLGTDSLASARHLSMLENLKLLQEAFTTLSFETMLCWATLNGARLLGEDHRLGAIAVGMRPGLVHIRHVDNSSKKILPNAVACRIA